jgi:hypothetical protein
MKIKFNLTSDEEIEIIGVDDKGEKSIGHIFTPSGSSETTLNAIQICGFDEAFDLWGCGIFGDKKTGRMKKDIQLCWFGNYDKMSTSEKMHISTPRLNSDFSYSKNRFCSDVCQKCFNYPCTCESHVTYDNPFTVKREQDLRNVLQIKEKPKEEEKEGVFDKSMRIHMENLEAKPVKDRTTEDHQFLINRKHNGSIRDYLLSMGQFKEEEIEE